MQLGGRARGRPPRPVTLPLPAGRSRASGFPMPFVEQGILAPPPLGLLIAMAARLPIAASSGLIRRSLPSSTA